MGLNGIYLLTCVSVGSTICKEFETLNESATIFYKKDTFL